MVRLADEHGIEIKGRPGIEMSVLRAREGLDNDDEEDDTEDKNTKAWKPEDDYNDEGARMWRRWDWKKEVRRQLAPTNSA